MRLILKLFLSTMKRGLKTNITWYDESTWNTLTFLCKILIFQFKDTLWVSCIVHWSKNCHHVAVFTTNKKYIFGGKIKRFSDQNVQLKIIHILIYHYVVKLVQIEMMQYTFVTYNCLS
jgi:hypothetical protein